MILFCGLCGFILVIFIIALWIYVEVIKMVSGT